MSCSVNICFRCCQNSDRAKQWPQLKLSACTLFYSIQCLLAAGSAASHTNYAAASLTNLSDNLQQCVQHQLGAVRNQRTTSAGTCTA